MKVSTYTNGVFSVNTYYLQDDGTVIIIDPGSNLSLLLEDIAKDDSYPEAILITHPHIDHVEGVALLKNNFPRCNVFMSSEGETFLDEISHQAHRYGRPDPGKIKVNSAITSENPFRIGATAITPINTPGHCPGSISFLIGSNLFSGDTLFKGTIGRSDVPGGNGKLLIESIMNKLLTLPDNTIVYPGHGDPSTIGREKKSNPYLSRR